jgi:hypothetical protein
MRGKWKKACGIRGDAQRTTKKKQGPLSPQSLADNISKLSREQMEGLFNQMVQCVVGWGLLDGERIVALDGSKLRTPATYEGCGKLKQTRRVKVKGQKEHAIEEYYVYGWKVLVLIDVHTRLPLAMKVVQIQEYEGRWLVPLYWLLGTSVPKLNNLVYHHPPIFFVM